MNYLDKAFLDYSPLYKLQADKNPADPLSIFTFTQTFIDAYIC